MNDQQKCEPVKLGVYIRPLSLAEESVGSLQIVSTSENEVKVSMGDGRGIKSYECDFEPFYFGGDISRGRFCSMNDVCEVLGQVILKQTFAGCNATVFTYGASKTGKSTVVYGDVEEDGLILYVLKNLFQRAESCDVGTSFRCEISFFEICGDTITDLISKRGNIKSQDVLKLKVKEDSRSGVYVEKLSKHIVTDMVETIKLYEKGIKNRKRLAKLDPDSQDHSHSIFTIVFTQARLENGSPCELVSKVNIIDLGSKDGYSGHHGDDFVNGESEEAVEEDHTKQRGPLESLQDVIRLLAAQNYGSMSYGSSMMMSSYGSTGIPYRDSNLTWLMRDALGGNCETIMLCCISPVEESRNETLNSLKYGNLARHIRNNVFPNEDQNVKMIRELREEIDKIKSQASIASPVEKEAERKLQRDQDLMNRLTGIWEGKWNKAQQLIEDQELDVTDLGGTGLRLATKEPHFISLGGGRLSVGVSIIPIKQGYTTVGSGGEGQEVDLLVRGKGVSSIHCLVEYDGESVVLHPKNELVSVDGVPLSAPTKLPQGCMVCLGKNNFFRFNHPVEAARIKAQVTASRFSIVPDGVYPDVQLAIEQRRKEMQERETLRAENKRLLAMEQQYVQSLERLELEKAQLEQEKRKLQVLQQQQQSVANQLDMKLQIQIEELKIQKEELKSLSVEKQRLAEKERQIENSAKRSEEERRRKEEEERLVRDRILSEQSMLDLVEFEELEKSLMSEVDGPSQSPLLRQKSKMEDKAHALEDEKHRLALLELDLLTEDLEFHDRYRTQKEELDRERLRLEEMESKHREIERSLSEQIGRLQRERQAELAKIDREKERLHWLEKAQAEAIAKIEMEQARLREEKQNDELKLAQEREQVLTAESARMEALQQAVDEQEMEREAIAREKMRLIDLEELHKHALKELAQDMISQQEKLERERQLELEFIEAEQLMLEELEQKQFESARQIECKTKAIIDQAESERSLELTRLQSTEKYIDELRREHEQALQKSEAERLKMQRLREQEQEQLRLEREKLQKMEEEYKKFLDELEQEKEELRVRLEREKDEEIAKMKKEAAGPAGLVSPLLGNSPPGSPKRLLSDDYDPALLVRMRTPEGKMQQIEEERQRLSELKRVAAEKAELEWSEKKKDLERRQLEERELRVKRERLEELRQEQEKQVEVERQHIQMESEKIRQHEQALKEREKELASLQEERRRRKELEKMLQDEKLNESILEQTLNEEKRRLDVLEKSLQEERIKRAEIEKRLEDRQREDDDRLRLPADDKKKPTPDLKSNGTVSSGNGTLQRRLPSYTLSVRSGASVGNAEDLNLLHHILSAGHVVDNCPSVRINRYSCRGYLQKMGQSRFSITWKKRWFVFDRKLRALCYYHDERKTKPKGFIYFQAIQEVYVDSSMKRSPNPKTTFCVKTPQRTFFMSAPSAIAMGIWIDVICTGKEGSLCAMTL